MNADAPALAPAGALARLGATALDAAVAALPLFILDMLAVGVVAVLWTLAYLAYGFNAAQDEVRAERGNPTIAPTTPTTPTTPASPAS